MDKTLLNHILLCVIEKNVTLKELELKTGEKEWKVRKASEKLLNIGLIKQQNGELMINKIDEQMYIRSVDLGISVVVLNLMTGSKKLDKEKIGRRFITG